MVAPVVMEIKYALYDFKRNPHNMPKAKIDDVVRFLYNEVIKEKNKRKKMPEFVLFRGGDSATPTMKWGYGEITKIINFEASVDIPTSSLEIYMEKDNVTAEELHTTFTIDLNDYFKGRYPYISDIVVKQIPSPSSSQLEAADNGILSPDDFMFYFRMMCAYESGMKKFRHGKPVNGKMPLFDVDENYLTAVESEFAYIIGTAGMQRQKHFRNLVKFIYKKGIKHNPSYDFSDQSDFKEAARTVNKEYFKK